MKKCLSMSSAAVVIGALRVNILFMHAYMFIYELASMKSRLNDIEMKI